MPSRLRVLLPACLAMIPLVFGACRSEQPRPQSEAVTAAAGSSAGRTPSAVAASPRPVPQPIMWDRLGSWTGKTSTQTESFTGTTGALRIVWTTKNPTAADGGSFRLTIHSAISGRPLDVAVDQRGPGADTAYVTEDPRVFFAVVEASNLEWAFTVDEAVGTRPLDEKR